jgi:hypothetical protein
VATSHNRTGHDNHGGDVLDVTAVVVTALDGWPLWTSDVRPGHEHEAPISVTTPCVSDRNRASRHPQPPINATMN